MYIYIVQCLCFQPTYEWLFETRKIIQYFIQFLTVPRFLADKHLADQNLVDRNLVDQIFDRPTQFHRHNHDLCHLINS